MNKHGLRIISTFLVLNMVLFTSGCSLFAAKMQPLTVTTSENDADIYINGNLEGKGVVQTIVPRNRNVAILAKKEGFNVALRTIGTTVSTTGTLDIIGGCLILIPFFGLLGPGFYMLDTDNVTLLMNEKKD